MEIVKKLQKWISDNHLNVEEVDGLSIFKIGEESFLLLSHEGSVFNEDFHLVVSDGDINFISTSNIKNYCFLFGGQFYYTPVDSIDSPELNKLKYIGDSILNDSDLPYSFLGLRGQYELCNGSGSYEEWINKAKFMGVKSLGICEQNTLAGTLAFQLECKKHKMDFVLGETLKVITDDSYEYSVKCYVTSKVGWFNILGLNKIINVDKSFLGMVSEEDLLLHGKGLILVFDSETDLNKIKFDDFHKSFEDIFYQIDLTEFKGDGKSKRRLLSISDYFQQFINKVKPVLIQDAFYLDKEYSHVKKILNKVGNVKYQFDSQDQYFKHTIEIFEQWQKLFKEEDDRFFEIFTESLSNTNVIAEKCKYDIEVGTRYLPNYIHTDLNESNEDLFYRLLMEGMQEKIIGKVEDEDIYWKRLEVEIGVIKKGDVVDYFLILWDIVNFCNRENILVGIGRGSGAGSLCTYLLGITGLDPIKYGLLFERFLNEGRVKTSLPDLDTDFEGLRREEVKRYMESKYGEHHVCSIGTYGTFKLKSAIKDIGKRMGLRHIDANFITKSMQLSADTDDKFKYLFIESIEKKKLGNKSIRDFIDVYPHIVNTLPIPLGQVKNASVHACATIIFPKKDKDGDDRNIYNWIPVKQMDGVLVSEWESEYIEKAGFLKEDILGIKQLDKFRNIFDKVKENKGITLKMDSVDLEDPIIYEYFGKGLNADVFHFGSKGLTSYGQEVKPDCMEDMIAMISLYRPGAMESNAHMDFIKLKKGLKEPVYDYMLEEVTKDTYGLYIYQEQVMKAVQVLGGFDLVTADDIRKAMGKKSIKLIKEYQAQFVKGAIEKGCDEIDAVSIWNKLEAFAGYGFNRSHAASYAIIGVMCQWLKIKFPVEFFVSAFEFVESNEQIQTLVSEINKLDGQVKVLPPCINESKDKFYANMNTGEIFWSISKIKFIGEEASKNIMNEREVNGNFFSIEEFLERFQNRFKKKEDSKERAHNPVNKRVVENLIFSGAFDKMYNIEEGMYAKRRELIDKFYITAKISEKDRISFDSKSYNEWWWLMKQREISGLGFLDFQKFIYESELSFFSGNYIDNSEFFLEDSIGREVVIGGIMLESKVKKTKFGDEFAIVTIQSNDEPITIMIWPEVWKFLKEEYSDGKILLITGAIHKDNYRKINTLQTTKTSKFQVL